MHSIPAQIVYGPNRIRLTTVAVFAGQQRVLANIDKSLERRENRRTYEEKASAKATDNDLRPEYDLSQLKGGVRGKYYQQASVGTNLVLIEPKLARVFPDTESVNRALKLLVDTAAAAASHRRRKAPNKRLKRTA